MNRMPLTVPIIENPGSKNAEYKEIDVDNLDEAVEFCQQSGAPVAKIFDDDGLVATWNLQDGLTELQ